MDHSILPKLWLNLTVTLWQKCVRKIMVRLSTSQLKKSPFTSTRRSELVRETCEVSRGFARLRGSSQRPQDRFIGSRSMHRTFNMVNKHKCNSAKSWHPSCQLTFKNEVNHGLVEPFYSDDVVIRHSERDSNKWFFLQEELTNSRCVSWLR